jgi:hypothetical protein
MTEHGPQVLELEKNPVKQEMQVVALQKPQLAVKFWQEMQVEFERAKPGLQLLQAFVTQVTQFETADPQVVH